MEVDSLRASFTLIELLITIGIVTILSVVVVLTLNPAQLLRQARDSTRLSDLDTLNRALNLFQVDVSGGSTGSVNTIYVSIPDSSSTCGNSGLPPLPSGWSYRCATAANYKKVDGNGWISVNFTSISSGSPLGVLPVDPVNTTSTGSYYYTYTPGSWELTAIFESTKYAETAAGDGGPDLATYEVGPDVTLSPFAHGMVGYWKFDEGAGTAASDSSRSGNTGTLTGSPLPAWVSGKMGTAVSFNGAGTNPNGSANYVQAANSSTLNSPTSSLTIAGWIYMPTTATGTMTIATKGNVFGGAGTVQYHFTLDNVNQIQLYVSNGTSVYGETSDTSIATSAWTHVAGVFSNSNITLYRNGVAVGTTTGGSPISAITPTSIALAVGKDVYSDRYGLNGYVDELRVYNRALSATEIRAIYNATK